MIFLRLIQKRWRGVIGGRLHRRIRAIWSFWGGFFIEWGGFIATSLNR